MMIIITLIQFLSVDEVEAEAELEAEAEAYWAFDAQASITNHQPPLYPCPWSLFWSRPRWTPAKILNQSDGHVRNANLHQFIGVIRNGQECRTLALGRHIDMMFQVVCLRGHRLALNVAAKGMGLPGKFAGFDGNQAALLWAMGEREKVFDYVAQDVKTTMELALICEKEGFLGST